MSSVRYQVETGILASEVQGETILLHLDGGTYFGLNPAASRLWALLVHGATVEQLVQHTIAGFDVAAEQCRNDIDKLLGELLGHGLIRIDSAPETAPQ